MNWMFTRRRDPDAYADAVVEALASHFPDLCATLTASIVRGSVAGFAERGGDGFEVILDSPYVGNWRLKPHPDRPKRVRLACCRLTGATPEDQARVERINAELGRID